MKSNLHKAICDMHRAIADHHDRCAKAFHRHALGCDEEDPHRGFFDEQSDEHKAMSAHHRAAAAEVEASPEVDEFEPHSNGAPQKATSAPFNRREFETDCAALLPELRKLLI